MKRSIILTLALTLLVFPAICTADSSASAELGKWWKDSEVVRQLQLTDTQVTRIEQIFLSYRPALAKLSAELKQKEDELSTLMEADTIDQARVRNMTESIAASRAELEKANSAMTIAIRQELSKEQWNKLQEIRKLRRSSAAMVTPGSAVTPNEFRDRIFHVGDGIKAPKVLYQPLPPMTPEAKAAGAEGIVLLQGIIRKNGRITDVKILRGLGYGLDESAIHTITNEWRFEPGTLNGEPVDVQANIEVSFRLY